MVEDGESRVFAGDGYGGQFLFVSPEHDLVAVFNGWEIHEGGNLDAPPADPQLLGAYNGGTADNVVTEHRTATPRHVGPTLR